MPKYGAELILSLGANLTSAIGAPEKTLRAALQLVAQKGGAIRSVSRFYHTPAFPKGNGPDYVNAAAVCYAPWTADDALEVMHSIEQELGRERVRRWGQRTLDIDIVALGDLVLPDPKVHAQWRDLPLEAQMQQTPDQLILPHPRMQDRAFVLVPMQDVAPGWVHPILQLSVTEMLDRLPKDDINSVQVLE